MKCRRVQKFHHSSSNKRINTTESNGKRGNPNKKENSLTLPSAICQHVRKCLLYRFVCERLWTWQHTAFRICWAANSIRIKSEHIKFQSPYADGIAIAEFFLGEKKRIPSDAEPNNKLKVGFFRICLAHSLTIFSSNVCSCESSLEIPCARQH